MHMINNVGMLGVMLAGAVLFFAICLPIMNGQDKALAEHKCYGSLGNADYCAVCLRRII